MPQGQRVGIVNRPIAREAQLCIVRSAKYRSFPGPAVLARDFHHLCSAFRSPQICGLWLAAPFDQYPNPTQTNPT